MTGTDLRRAGSRARTAADGVQTWHSLSFGRHYDPANTHFGLLLAHNEDLLAAGAGYGSHPHRDTEIVTWVLSGSLVHEDSTGRAALVRPGQAQRVSAGSGIVHAETNDSWRLTGEPAHGEPVHLVQMWVRPDAVDAPPGYACAEVSDATLREGLVPVVSGRRRHLRHGAVRLAQRDAALLVARLAVGASATLPEARWVHLFVARGEVVLERSRPARAGGRRAGGRRRRAARRGDGRGGGARLGDARGRLRRLRQPRLARTVVVPSSRSRESGGPGATTASHPDRWRSGLVGGAGTAATEQELHDAAGRTGRGARGGRAQGHRRAGGGHLPRPVLRPHPRRGPGLPQHRRARRRRAPPPRLRGPPRRRRARWSPVRASEGDRTGSVVDIVIEDMPFLIDSVGMELNRHESRHPAARAPAGAGPPRRRRAG